MPAPQKPGEQEMFTLVFSGQCWDNHTVMDNMQGYTFQLSEQMPENPSKTSVRKYACRVLACPAFVVGTEDAFTVGDRQQAGQKGFEN